MPQLLLRDVIGGSGGPGASKWAKHRFTLSKNPGSASAAPSAVNRMSRICRGAKGKPVLLALYDSAIPRLPAASYATRASWTVSGVAPSGGL